MHTHTHAAGMNCDGFSCLSTRSISSSLLNADLGVCLANFHTVTPQYSQLLWQLEDEYSLFWFVDIHNDISGYGRSLWILERAGVKQRTLKGCGYIFTHYHLPVCLLYCAITRKGPGTPLFCAASNWEESKLINLLWAEYPQFLYKCIRLWSIFKYMQWSWTVLPHCELLNTDFSVSDSELGEVKSILFSFQKGCLPYINDI